MSYPEYSFQNRFLMLRGTRLHYLDEGPADGEPVVMVHGNPTWSFFFRKPMEALSARYRTVAIDHIGMGLSGVPGDDEYEYTLQSRIEDLETLLDHRGIDSGVTLVVHDWGGAIGLGYAMRHPGRVRRLVVLNTAAFHLPEGKAFPRNLAVVRTAFVGPFLVRGLNGFSREAVRRCAVTRLSPGVRRGYLEPYNTWHNRLAVLRFVQDIPVRPTDRAYDQVSEIGESISRYQEMPVLICWGMRDFLFDSEILAEWTRRLPEAEVHRFDNAGHYLLEDAGEAVTEAIRSFLERHPLSTASEAAPESS